MSKNKLEELEGKISDLCKIVKASEFLCEVNNINVSETLDSMSIIIEDASNSVLEALEPFFDAYFNAKYETVFGEDNCYEEYLARTELGAIFFCDDIEIHWLSFIYPVDFFYFLKDTYKIKVTICGERVHFGKEMKS